MDDDTLVLAGDHSWGKNLPECELDLQYICDLPGRKILLRGNHDMFWDVKKTGQLNGVRRLPALEAAEDTGIGNERDDSTLGLGQRFLPIVG